MEPSHQPKVFIPSFTCFIVGAWETFDFCPPVSYHPSSSSSLIVTEKDVIDSFGFSTLITLTSMSKGNFISYLARYRHLFSLPYFYLHMCTCVLMLTCTYGCGCLWRPEEDIRPLRAADYEPLSVGPGN